MGLSGRKVKQRIPDDPRNLSWADDAARFGSNYLSKFGWDSSQGLGASGDGRTSHIKVSHKLDMLGIGAAHQKDPNGIAWKQNKEFEALLKRLNDAKEAEKNANVLSEGKGEVRGEPISATDENKKRKRSGNEEEKKEKKKRKKEQKIDDSANEDLEKEGSAVPSPPLSNPKTPAVPRRRAHRARAIAAKNISSKSAASISEILGIAPTPSSTNTLRYGIPQGKLTSCDDDSIQIEKITTSTKSVSDYFKEKLRAKASNNTTLPCIEATESQAKTNADTYETSRGGLGSSRSQVENKDSTMDSMTNRTGISKFSSLMSSTFLAATTSVSFVTDPANVPSKPSDSSSSELSDAVIKSSKHKKSSNEKSIDGNEKAVRKEKKEAKKEKRRKVDSDIGEGHDDTEPEDTAARKKRRKQEKARRRALNEREVTEL